ncbi:kinase-like domain-containing protein [Flagelloscypha sp. PMI_526]|nr:kinase-like domain-containing protein [Flagelloscypha sp. PMI_526]
MPLTLQQLSTFYDPAEVTNPLHERKLSCWSSELKSAIIKLKGYSDISNHRSCVDAARYIARSLLLSSSFALDHINDYLSPTTRIEWAAYDEDGKPNSMGILCAEDLHVFSLDSSWTLPQASSSQLLNALERRGGIPTQTQVKSFSPPAAASFLMLLRYNLMTQDLSHHSRRILLRLIRSIALEHSILPSSFRMQGITAEAIPIAGGGYADVHRGYSANKQTLCLKVLRVFRNPHNSGPDEQSKEAVLRAFLCEALLWYQLRHRNILPFLGVSYDAFPNRICFVSPFKKNGDIMSFIKRCAPLLEVRTEWLLQIAQGVEYIHEMEISHGDIKGINILVDDDGRPLIADLGIATVVTSQSETLRIVRTTDQGFKCSLRWSPPEVVHPDHEESDMSHISTTTDIYALVSTMLEILTGMPPWSEERLDARIIYRLLAGDRPRRPDPCVIPDDLWDLIERGWKQNPRERATIGELIKNLETMVANPRRDAFKTPWQLNTSDKSSLASGLEGKLVSWERPPTAYVQPRPVTSLVFEPISPSNSEHTAECISSSNQTSAYHSTTSFRLSEQSLRNFNESYNNDKQNRIAMWIAQTTLSSPTAPALFELPHPQDTRLRKRQHRCSTRTTHLCDALRLDTAKLNPTLLADQLQSYAALHASEETLSDVSTLSPSGKPPSDRADRFLPWAHLHATKLLKNGRRMRWERSIQSSPTQIPVRRTPFRPSSRPFIIRKSVKRWKRERTCGGRWSDSTPEPASSIDDSDRSGHSSVDSMSDFGDIL